MESACNELSIWIAYELGQWPLRRIQSAENGRYGHSRYAMILKRLRASQAKMKATDLIRKRVSGIHNVTSEAC